jgi:hypothetical protein
MDREEKLNLIRADLKENKHYVDGFFEDFRNGGIGAYVIPIGLPPYQNDPMTEEDTLKQLFFHHADFSSWHEWQFPKTGEFYSDSYEKGTSTSSALEQLSLFEELVRSGRLSAFLSEREELSNQYELLGRLKSDVDYLLNYGSFETDDLEYTKRILENRLWGGTTGHFAKMIELLNEFSEEHKPEWYSMAELKKDKERMEAMYGLVLN